MLRGGGPKDTGLNHSANCSSDNTAFVVLHLKYFHRSLIEFFCGDGWEGGGGDCLQLTSYPPRSPEGIPA